MARQPKLTVVADDGAPPGVEIRGPARPGQDEILAPEALEFIAMLERKFGSERRALLDRRADVQARLDHGAKPDFLAGTADIRNGDWTVGPVPDDLQDRVGDFTTNQLIGLRFAPDDELPELARRVLDEGISDRKTIKQAIKNWRADTQRI